MTSVLSLCLQEPALRWKTHPVHLPRLPPAHSFARFHVRKSFDKIRVKCCLNSPESKQSLNEEVVRAHFLNPGALKRDLQFLVNEIQNVLRGLQKPAVAAVIIALLLFHNPAMAASGGRMGGRSFSSRSSPSTSRSYSAPSMGSGFSYSMPYYGPSPFGGIYVVPAFGIGSGFYLIVIAFAAFLLVSGFLSGDSDGSVLTATEKTSVLKMQVGLLGLARSLQRDLNRIANTADTSTPEGLHHVLTETILALLRHPDYCISAYSSVDKKSSLEAGEKRFNQLSIEERGKFDEETLVNINNIKRQGSAILSKTGFSNEYIVITILVAAEGNYSLPTINNSNDLKEALQKLASIPSSKTIAVEVLWTPQNEDDSLSEEKLLEDYALLRPL